MGKLEVLISAMHQKDFSLLDQTRIRSDALLINQCDEDGYREKKEPYGLLRCVSTKERGVSRSRNKALENSNAEIVLLCDDDEILYDNYTMNIEKAFESRPDVDVICFQVNCAGKRYSKKEFQLGYLTSLKIASWQIAFRLDSVKKKNILFDINFGSGTPVGSGEENIFLYDCLKSKLKVCYVPICIGEVAQEKSNWFKGFTQTYFFNRGKVIRRLMGLFWGMGYCVYFVIAKHQLYKKETSFASACKNIVKGFFLGA